MDFPYANEIYRAFEPGDRAWACGFRVSDPPSKVVRDLPPVYVQFCNDRRSIVPVHPDGNLAFTKATGLYGLHFFDDKADAEAAYRSDLEQADGKLRDKIASLQNIRDRIGDALSKLGD